MTPMKSPDPAEEMPDGRDLESERVGHGGSGAAGPRRGRPPKNGGRPLRQVPLYMSETVHKALKWQATLDGKSMSEWVLERIMPDLRDAMRFVEEQSERRDEA